MLQHRALASLAQATPIRRVVPVLLLTLVTVACRTVAPSPDEAAMGACDMGMNLRRMPPLPVSALSRPVTRAGCLQLKCTVTMEGDVQHCGVAQVEAVHEHIGDVIRWFESHPMRPVTFHGKPVTVRMVFVVRLAPTPPADGGTPPAASEPAAERR